MRQQQLNLTVAVTAVMVVTGWIVYNRGVGQSEDTTFGVNGNVWQYEAVPFDNGAVGPESFAFDPHGEGPYTGVSDGRIIKWVRPLNRWINFAVTSSQSRWRSEGLLAVGRDDKCGGPHTEHSKREHICGRPLGLCFSISSGDLYIADAYKGLIVVGSNGGTAKRVISEVDGEPFSFTNSLDIDQRTGVVYFTTSSSNYERRNYISLILSRDKTGKLMKYEPQNGKVTVLLNNLSFPNGVALSKDSDYILLVDTTNCKVLRYWLETPRAGTLEVFVANLPGFPDNIKRSPRGGFWVGIYSRREKLVQLILSYRWIGKALLTLPLDITKAYKYLAKLKGSSGFAIRLSEEGDVLETIGDKSENRGRSISEVEERDGMLWLGSVDAPFATKYGIIATQDKADR